MKRPIDELLTILRNLLYDCGERCCTDFKELDRDFEYILDRTKHEGLSFLTIALPAFGDDIFLSLSQEQVGLESFLGFKRFRCLPSFLRGFTHQVFNSLNGKILVEVNVDAVKSLRQICYLAKKIKLPCTDNRTENAYIDYQKTDENLSEPEWKSTECSRYAEVSRMLCQNVFSDYSVLRINAHPGPGAVADRLKPNQKFSSLINWPKAFETIFPYDLLCCYNVNHMVDVIDSLNEVEELCPIRLGTVPKTQKSPRIIGMEPNAAMFAQQGLKEYMYDNLESHWITSGHINFRDQKINQCLALTSSVTGRRATLDMKKASDMVLVSHVEVAYGGVPQFLEALLACRSDRAELPSGEVLSLKKFASMGSAVCFPVEAVHFFCICVSALLEKAGLPTTLRNIYNVSRDVYVYGDDIIVPTDAVPLVLHYMHNLKAIVNHKKSFYTGRFRESCGLDAYDGYEVTPIYLRSLLPQDKADVSAFLSSVATGNQLYTAGYYRTFEYLRKKIDSKDLYGRLPSIRHLETCVIGWLKPFKIPNSRTRYNKNWHNEELLAPVVLPVREKDRLEGWPALLKFELNRKKGEPRPVFFQALDEPLSPVGKKKREKELTLQETSVRRGAVRIESRWVSSEIC